MSVIESPGYFTQRRQLCEPWYTSHCFTMISHWRQGTGWTGTRNDRYRDQRLFGFRSSCRTLFQFMLRGIKCMQRGLLWYLVARDWSLPADIFHLLRACSRQHASCTLLGKHNLLGSPLLWEQTFEPSWWAESRRSYLHKKQVWMSIYQVLIVKMFWLILIGSCGPQLTRPLFVLIMTVCLERHHVSLVSQSWASQIII